MGGVRHLMRFCELLCYHFVRPISSGSEPAAAVEGGVGLAQGKVVGD